jgi:hypothetical protein
LERHYERAEVDVQRTNGGRQFEITTKNLTRLTLRETSKAAGIRIDGQSLKVKAAPEIVLERSGSAWRLANAGKWAGLHKTHALQGPIDDAFLDPFLLVRPTGTPWNEAANQHALRILSHFDRVYALNYRAHPRIKDDKDVTEADFAKYNVVLFGDPGSNLWIAKVQSRLPFRWTREAIQVGDAIFPAGEHLPVLGYPNPLQPSHYVVLNTGLTISDQDYNGDYAMPRFGDIAVLKIKDPSEPPQVAWGGLFDESWQLPKSTAIAGMR